MKKMFLSLLFYTPSTCQFLEIHNILLIHFITYQSTQAKMSMRFAKVFVIYNIVNCA